MMREREIGIFIFSMHVTYWMVEVNGRCYSTWPTCWHRAVVWTGRTPPRSFCPVHSVSHSQTLEGWDCGEGGGGVTNHSSPGLMLVSNIAKRGKLHLEFFLGIAIILFTWNLPPESRPSVIYNSTQVIWKHLCRICIV